MNNDNLASLSLLRARAWQKLARYSTLPLASRHIVGMAAAYGDEKNNGIFKRRRARWRRNMYVISAGGRGITTPSYFCALAWRAHRIIPVI